MPSPDLWTDFQRLRGFGGRLQGTPGCDAAFEFVKARLGELGEVLEVPTALVKALAGAFRYQRLLDEERYASISEMAAAERIERRYLGTLLRLTLLAPEVVEAPMDERATCEIGLPKLLAPPGGVGLAAQGPPLNNVCFALISAMKVGPIAWNAARCEPSPPVNQ